MARTHAQQFANLTLPSAVFANPLGLTRAIVSGNAAMVLASLWEQAGAELAPIARIPGTGFTATLERRGLYSIAIVTPPVPREPGDPAAIAIIGRGDGQTKLSTLAYYVLELAKDRSTGAPRFTIASRTDLDESGAICGDGPLPDPAWLAHHAFELYAGRTPSPIIGIPALPFWYWWHAFDGAAAIRTLGGAMTTADRFEAVRVAPILLLPEIADAAEVYVGASIACTLRELRADLRRDPSLAAAWQALAHRLANTTTGSPAANTTRAIPLIAEAAEHGALCCAQAYELLALVRSRLARLGVDAAENDALAHQLFAAATDAQRSRLARGSVPPPIHVDDPLWAPLFLAGTDLPQGCIPAEHDEVFSSNEPLFVGYGGLRAGYAVWWADERAAMARIVDARWVFRTAMAARSFMCAAAAAFADGLPQLPAPQLGDDTLAFGGELVVGDSIRRSQVIVVRVGRVVARLQACEGAHAAAARQILHAAMLQPLAHTIVERAHQGVAAYWLAVAYPTNAVPALVHSPGFDAARLLHKYPLLAHADLPAAIATLGDAYAAAARSLASFQAQVRAHRWSTYRDAMLALVQTLLVTEMGDPRVNAAHAHEIVTELRYLDHDPVWLTLDAACRARQ